MNPVGHRLFARYAYAPNHLGYCGPAEAAALFELGCTGTTDADVHTIARRFSGAWPYAQLLASLAGIDDPLDEAVMRGYWLGDELLTDVSNAEFGAALLDVLGPRAGHYWAHLSPELLPEAAPTHAFHVFAVYPWTRLLTAGPTEALHVLDSCRITPAHVVAVDDDGAVVAAERLTWDGQRLGLAPASESRVQLTVDGRGFVEALEPGQWLATHWGWAADRISDAERDSLDASTRWQLARTNERLVREAAS